MGERVTKEKPIFKFAIHIESQLKPKKWKPILVTLSTQFIIAQATQAQLAHGHMLQDGHAEGDFPLSAAVLCPPLPDPLWTTGPAPAPPTL